MRLSWAQTVAGGLTLAVVAGLMLLLMGLAKMGGTVMVYGMASAEDRLAVSPYEVFRRELTIKGSFAQTHCFDRAIALLRSGRVRTEGIDFTTSYERNWSVGTLKLGLGGTLCHELGDHVHGHASAAKDRLAAHDVGIADDQAAGAVQLARRCGRVGRGRSAPFAS